MAGAPLEQHHAAGKRVTRGDPGGSLLYPVLWGRLGSIGACSGSAIRKGTVGAVRHSQGACRSKGLVAGEHPPDRFGETACDLGGSEGGAAPAAVPVAHAFDDRLVVGGASGGVGGLDQRPAEAVGAV